VIFNGEEDVTKRHRGSSPPFQESEQGEFDWMKTPTPNPQTNHPVLPSDEVKSDEEKADESRWQDDGGESGSEG
jgi:hypothetical protein